MPVTQIDKDGYIKGTKKKYAMKVKVLSPMLYQGTHLSVGDVLDLEGAFLAESLAYKKVEPFIEKPKLSDAESDEIIANMEVELPADQQEPKKLGPKKRKSKNN
jgi:hypothetical protein